ncbi:MAG: hypothetical protein JWN17_3126 [Frankiales bacterium]|nr:hypothetical protein [Frankiales bacterium]
MIAAPTRLGPDRPLRVHVVGSSAAVLVEPQHGPRDGGTYGEQLAGVLGGRGVPTTVSHAGRWFGRVCDLLPHYERDVRDRFPDVLVVNFGMAECQSNALPYSVVRHLTTWDRSSRPAALLYREKVAPRLWRPLRDYQRAAAARDTRTHRLSPARFVADTTRLVELVRKDCGSLVLLLDVDPPGDRVEHWLPGTRARAAAYTELLAGVADRYDDTVRLVRAGAALTDPAVELPDGLHRSPAGHARTAALLAEEVLSWLAR